MNIETIPSSKNCPNILNGVATLNVSCSPEALVYKNPATVLNSIMATASLTIPSPKTKLKSLGYSSYLMIVIAASTSEEHINELSCRICIMLKSTLLYSL
jgi:hypothetical protein